MSKRRNAHQVKADAIHAEGGLYDVVLHTPGGIVRPLEDGPIQAGVKRGREAEFIAALAGMPDDATRRLVAQAGQRGVRTPEFRIALAAWVRECRQRGVKVPDSVDVRPATP